MTCDGTRSTKYYFLWYYFLLVCELWKMILFFDKATFFKTFNVLINLLEAKSDYPIFPCWLTFLWYHLMFLSLWQQMPIVLSMKNDLLILNVFLKIICVGTISCLNILDLFFNSYFWLRMYLCLHNFIDILKLALQDIFLYVSEVYFQ
jgi:hypothetical protein